MRRATRTLQSTQRMHVSIYTRLRLIPARALVVCTLFACVVCMCTLRRPIQPPTKFLGPPTRCIHSSVCTAAAARRMHVRAIIITRIPIVNYRSARFRKYTPATSSWIHVTILVTPTQSILESFHSLARC